MKRKLTIWISLFFMAASLFASGKKKKSVSEKMPDWVNNPTAAYSEKSYITGVGSSKKRSDAETDAIASIGKYLNQSIQAEEQVTQADSTATGLSESYLSTMKTQTSLKEIAGVSIKENWTASDGTEYALAILNRTESGQYYRNKIEENDKTISELLVQANNETGSLSSVGLAVKAYDLAKDNDYYLSLLAIIKPVYHSTSSVSYGSSNSVAQKVSDLLSHVNIMVAVDGDTDGRIASAFAASLSSLGIKSYGGTSGGEKIKYALLANIAYEPVTIPDSKYFFCRYSIKVEVIDQASGKNVLPWSKTGRVGKLTAQEAQIAAVKSVENAVTNDFSATLSSSLK